MLHAHTAKQNFKRLLRCCITLTKIYHFTLTGIVQEIYEQAALIPQPLSDYKEPFEPMSQGGSMGEAA
jgi:hypothetical protein